MAWDFSNGLLGMGGFGMGGNNMPANSLLGDFYDPAEARKYQMKQMLLGLGAGLMAEKGIGKGAALALAAGDRAGSQYRDNAMDAYRIKSQQDQQAKADERWQMEWDWRKQQAEEAAKRQSAIDERNNIEFGWRQDEQDRATEQRAATERTVTNWMDSAEQQGASLPFSPGVRSIARQGGLSGPSATDQWRFDNAQPYVGAQDFGNAFQQITAQPPAPEPPKTRTIRRGNQQVTQEWNPGTATYEDVSQGPAFKDTPDTVINNGGDLKLTESQSKDIHFYSRGKYANADLTANEDALLALGQKQGSQVPVVGNYLKTPEYRQAERAGKEFLAMVLRKESGGAITAEEWAEYGPMFLPMPGDDPQTVADKRVARQRALDALKLGGGTATPLFDQVDRKFMASGLPPEAVNELRSDPSPQARQEFDAVFGEGASAAVLGGN